MKDGVKHGGAPNESKVNQQLIADRLGISRTTVSRCFTNHSGINPVTRARVFDLASQLGYQHMEMRTPSRGRAVTAKTIGVLVCSDLEEYFHSDYESPGVKLYAGVAEFAQLNKVKLDLHYVSPKETDFTGPSYRKLSSLHNREWDGVLLIYPFPRNIVDEIDMKFPMVSLVEQYGAGVFNCTDVDHYKGIAMIINRLEEYGHERIGFYTKRYSVEAEWSMRRFSAYIEKMARRKILPDPADIVNVYPGVYYPTREESFRYIISRIEQGVTAWVCAADHQAYDLIAALQKKGIRVPEDVSVTGFDGIRKPDWAPLLTTVVVPYWEIGYTSGKRLLDIMKKRFGSPHHILISPQIREGETIGPVRANAQFTVPVTTSPDSTETPA